MEWLPALTNWRASSSSNCGRLMAGAQHEQNQCFLGSFLREVAVVFGTKQLVIYGVPHRWLVVNQPTHRNVLIKSYKHVTRPRQSNQMRFNTNSCGYLEDTASWLVPQRSLHPTPELKNLHDNLIIGRSPFKWLVTTLNLSFTEFATFFGSVQTEHMRNMHMSIVKILCIS